METRTWEPKYDGHAPPNWRWGMAYWVLECKKAEPFSYLDGPAWWCGNEYLVEAEALNGPNDNVFAAPAPQKWFGQDSIDPIAATVAQLRQYHAEELAKHGITLAPEKDWATELWADLFTIRGMTGFAENIREGRIDDDDRVAIELLRTRFEQMIAERSES